jgi:hypothetical protein
VDIGNLKGSVPIASNGNASGLRRINSTSPPMTANAATPANMKIIAAPT